MTNHTPVLDLSQRDSQQRIVLRLNESDAAFIVRAVNSHGGLLDAAKNARNVLAGLVSGDLKTISGDSPALLALRAAITKAEGK